MPLIIVLTPYLQQMIFSFCDVSQHLNYARCMECVVPGGGWLGATKPIFCRFNVEQEKYKPWLNEKNWYFTMSDTLEIY
tara:strand:- start:214 stop:450 length:237 start_codon:yes stop_codon:yes gene_type:complete